MGQFIVSREKIEVVDPNTLVARDAGLFGLVVNKRDIGVRRFDYALDGEHICRNLILITYFSSSSAK